MSVGKLQRWKYSYPLLLPLLQPWPDTMKEAEGKLEQSGLVGVDHNSNCPVFQPLLQMGNAFSTQEFWASA